MPAAETETPPVQEEASVGVIGWLGFVIVNFAAFGIIGAGTGISWVVGFVLSTLYTVLLAVIAVQLFKRGPRYGQFVNLLWVLTCLFVFIDGLYIAINVVGPIDGEDVTVDFSPPPTDDLAALLPENASQALQEWSQDAKTYSNYPGFAVFGGYVFFSSPASAEGYENVLWRSDVGSSSLVEPNLSSPRGFVEFGSKLVFVARQMPSASYSDEVWFLDGASAAGAAERLFAAGSGSGQTQVSSLFVDADSSSLYFKASYYCDGWYVWSIFQSDGTPGSAVNLRGDSCASTTTGSSQGSGGPAGGTDAEYWGVVFLAAVPMLALATYVVLTRQMPGVFANLYGGVAVVFLMGFLLATGDTGDLLAFNKWFYTIYSSLLYVALVAVSALRDELPQWLEEMKTWAVALAAGTFFVIIHVDLEIPWAGEAWAWVVYSILALLQMAASVVLARTVPMICGACSAFVISWKISWETVILFGGDEWGSDLQLLTVFGLMALLGLGVIALAVLYASRRSEIEGAVRSALRRWRGEKAPMLPTEAAASDQP